MRNYTSSQRPRGRRAGAFGDKGDAAADAGALEACLAQAEALADELSKEDPKKGVYRKRLEDLAQHRAPRLPRPRPARTGSGRRGRAAL